MGRAPLTVCPAVAKVLPVCWAADAEECRRDSIQEDLLDGAPAGPRADVRPRLGPGPARFGRLMMSVAR
jgi:hypothetical protein